MEVIINPTVEQIQKIAKGDLRIDGSNLLYIAKNILYMFEDRTNKLKLVADIVKEMLREVRIEYLVGCIQKNGNAMDCLRAEAALAFSKNSQVRDPQTVAPYISIARLRYNIDQAELYAGIYEINWSDKDKNNNTKIIQQFKDRIREIKAEGIPL